MRVCALGSGCLPPRGVPDERLNVESLKFEFVRKVPVASVSL